MIEYVVGFVFDKEERHVILIQKNRPEWQKGKLNGPGGHIENNEDRYCAMTREFEEETGIFIHPHLWRIFCQLEHKKRNGYVYFLTAKISHYEFSKLTQTTDETPIICFLPSILNNPNIISNLKWLIPMALQDNIYAKIIDSEE